MVFFYISNSCFPFIRARWTLCKVVIFLDRKMANFLILWQAPLKKCALFLSIFLHSQFHTMLSFTLGNQPFWSVRYTTGWGCCPFYCIFTVFYHFYHIKPTKEGKSGTSVTPACSPAINFIHTEIQNWVFLLAIKKNPKPTFLCQSVFCEMSSMFMLSDCLFL